jgi:FlaA1/EpsC-like NDP-sugar epimerase
MVNYESIQKKIVSTSLNRRLWLGLGVQALIPIASLLVALLLRLDLDIDRIDFGAFFLWVSVLIALRLVALVWFDAHKGLWRYVSMTDMIGISRATTVATAIFIPLL